MGGHTPCIVSGPLARPSSERSADGTLQVSSVQRESLRSYTSPDLPRPQDPVVETGLSLCEAQTCAPLREPHATCTQKGASSFHTRGRQGVGQRHGGPWRDAAGLWPGGAGLGWPLPALQEGEEALSLCGFHTSRNLQWVLPASPTQGTPKAFPSPCPGRPNLRTAPACSEATC